MVDTISALVAAVLASWLTGRRFSIGCVNCIMLFPHLFLQIIESNRVVDTVSEFFQNSVMESSSIKGIVKHTRSSSLKSLSYYSLPCLYKTFFPPLFAF